MGKQLLEELKNANESIETDETKIKDIQNCWMATNSRLEEIRNRIEYLEEVKKFRTELASLNLMLDSYSKWFDSNKGNNQVEPFRVILFCFFFSKYFKYIFFLNLNKILNKILI